jgi:hypothetical protein
MGKIRTLTEKYKELEEPEESTQVKQERQSIMSGALPSEQIELLNKPLDPIEQNIEGDTETLVDQRTKRIKSGETIPLKSLANAPVFTEGQDEETIRTDTDKAKIKLAQEEFASQEAAKPIDMKPSFYEFSSEGELESNILEKGIDKTAIYKGVIPNILNKGREYANLFDKMSVNFTNDTQDVAIRAKNYLANNGLLSSPDGGPLVFDRKLPNALAIETISTIQDAFNLKQIKTVKGLNEDVTQEDVESVFGGIPMGDTFLPVTGDKIIPKYIKGTLAKNVLNKIIGNPYEKQVVTKESSRRPGTETMYTNYGGAGNELQKTDPDVFDYLDTQFWSVLDDDNLISLNTGTDGESFYEMNQRAVDYHFATSPYLRLRKSRLNVSYARPLEGQALPGAMMALEKGKPYTTKSKRAQNQQIQAETKDHLGSVVFMINKGLDRLGSQIIEQVVGKIPFRNGVPVFGADFKFSDMNDSEWQVDPNAKQLTDEEIRENLPAAARGPREGELIKSIKERQKTMPYPWGTVLFSTSPWAKLIGLDKEAWLDAYRTAERNPDYDQNEAINQANMVMMAKTKALLLDNDDAKLNLNKRFYNTVFDATANGRYHYRNQVLNPQDSKYVRNIVANPLAPSLDLENMSSKDKEILENSLYIMGYNLLPKKITNGVSTKNMGWNAIIDGTKRVLSRSNPDQESVYKEWLNLGYLFRSMTKGKMNSAMLYDLENYGNPDEHPVMMLLDDTISGPSPLSDKEEWGQKVQSYIDFANYHDAKEAIRKKKRAKELGKSGVEYIMTAKPDLTEAQENEIIKLQEAIQENKDAGQDDEVLILEGQLAALANSVSLVEKPQDSTVFKPLATTQADGKQSGIAIQAYQNGNEELLKLVGSIYASEDNVIPQGDIRDLFVRKADQAIKNIFSGDENKRDFWIDKFDEIKNNPAAVKALVKQPLMETSYGKSRKFHFESAENFMKSVNGAPIRKSLETAGNYLPGYTEANATDDLNEIISETLGLTLDLEHQRLMKDTGKFFAMMGITPYFRGPLGNTVWMGSKEFVPTGETLLIPTSKGFVEKEKGNMKASGTKRSKKTRVLDQESRQWRDSDPTPYGQEVANQYPVLSTQHIDSAIQAVAVNRVNSFRKKNRYEPAKFVVTIHDAFIADATSIRDYHRAFNKAFDDVNRSWHPDEAAAAGLNEAFAEVRAFIKPDKIYEISDNNIKYRALYSYVNSVFKQARERTILSQNLSEKVKSFTTKATNLGWSPESMIDNQTPGVKMTGENLIKLLALVNIHLNLNGRMAEQIRKSKIARAYVASKDIIVKVVDMDGNISYQKVNYHYN